MFPKLFIFYDCRSFFNAGHAIVDVSLAVLPPWRGTNRLYPTGRKGFIYFLVLCYFFCGKKVTKKAAGKPRLPPARAGTDVDGQGIPPVFRWEP